MGETTGQLPLTWPRPTWHQRGLSWLLWLANSAPPSTHRDRFYAMKQRILERYGERVGHDWQQITKTCYGCDGTGWYRHEEGCWRCSGTGIYDRFWCRLERWELAGRIFHRPVERTRIRPVEPVRIQGRIEHRSVGRAGCEAAFWLALWFDRRLLWDWLTGYTAIGPTWRYPLVTLQKLTYRLVCLRRRLGRRTCYCGRRFRTWFGAPG